MLKALLLAPAIILFAGAGIHYFLTWKNKMRNYQAIEPLIQAGIVASLTIVTTATLDTGEVYPVPNDTAVGDAVILNADSSVRVDKAADFDARYKAV